MNRVARTLSPKEPPRTSVPKEHSSTCRATCRRWQVIAEVLRIERHPGHPLAALQLLGETDEWKGLVWEPAAPRVAPPPPPEGEGEASAEDDDDVTH